MNEVVREFLLETHENLAQLDLDLVTLEKTPGDPETIARVFRTLHTVKGTAGFLGLEKLQSIAHPAETLLAKVRAGELPFGPPIASAMLGVVDAVRAILSWIESVESEGDGDYFALVARLEGLAAGAAPPPSAVAVAHGGGAAPGVGKFDAEIPAAPDAPGPSAVADSAIRVDVGLLDKLMDAVGELVLARNHLVLHTAALEDAALLGAVQRVNLLTTELQAGVMKTRMQPIGTVWGKFPRLVRDLAVACGKQVRFEMEGQETELDKTILEAIRDPLTHMVRNAVDHGIEAPAARTAAGKPAEGSLRLHAYHEGGKVVIEIADDGGGIDPQRVRDKAVRNGLVPADRALRLSERELLELVFLPGFSTAEQVTQFSGRGVGMDVVRTNIERIGGSVDLDSTPGAGTAVRMRIPLTLAIVPALTVAAGGERFAIPQVNLLEVVRLEGEQARRGIESFHGAPVHRLRGALLPLAYLDRELQLRPDGPRAPAEDATIVVLQADDRQFGLVVDAILDTEEIVVKPLQAQLKGLAAYSGATIMGDGGVALILDVLGLAQRANLLAGARERARVATAAAPANARTDRVSALVFAAPGGGRMAIALDQVDRLEEFPRAALERVGSRDVVQYRGGIMPLIPLAELLGEATPEADLGATVPALVHERDGRRVGLAVGRILDIVDEDLAARAPPTRPGILFNAVVQGKVAEFLDLDAALRRAEAAP